MVEVTACRTLRTDGSVGGRTRRTRCPPGRPAHPSRSRRRGPAAGRTGGQKVVGVPQMSQWIRFFTVLGSGTGRTPTPRAARRRADDPGKPRPRRARRQRRARSAHQRADPPWSAASTTTRTPGSPAARPAAGRTPQHSPPSGSASTVQRAGRADHPSRPAATRSSIAADDTSRCTRCLTVIGSGTALIQMACSGSVAGQPARCRRRPQPAVRAPAPRTPRRARRRRASMQRSLKAADRSRVGHLTGSLRGGPWDNSPRGFLNGQLGLHLPHPGPAGPGRGGRPGGQGARRRRPAPRRGSRTAGQGSRGRAVRPAPDLHPDGPGAQHRPVPGGDQRRGQHPPVRASRLRDPGDRRPVRPRRAAARPSGPVGDLRRRDATGPQPHEWELSEVALRDQPAPAVRAALRPPRTRDHRRLARDQAVRRRRRPAAPSSCWPRWRT